MDRNSYTGLFLIAIILIAFTYFNRPSQAELNREKRFQDSIAALKAGKNPGTVLNGAKPATVIDTTKKVFTGPFSEAKSGTAEMVNLENELVKIQISTLGGRIAFAQLKSFKTYAGTPLILMTGDQNQFGLNLKVDNQSFYTNDLYFKPSVKMLRAEGKDSSSVTLRLNYSDQKFIDYIYTLYGNSYTLGFKIKVVNLESQIAPDTRFLSLHWKSDIINQEKDVKAEFMYTSVYVKDNGGDIQNLNETKDETKKFDNPISWVSFKQHFFSVALLADQPFLTAEANSTTLLNPKLVKNMDATMTIPFAHKPENDYGMRIYLGPNKFTELKKVGADLDKSIPLGWGPLKWINRYAVLPVFDALGKLNLNYGIIILILTILLKLVLFPATYGSYLSTAKMRVIKPEMDEIKAKIGESDPTRLQQEYMKLYQKAGINPLGGCLPLLLQMPILFAFLRFFPNAFELRGQRFLFMEDLSTYDSVIHWNYDLPVLGNHLSIMCVLMAVTTLIYSLLNSQQMQGAGAQYKYLTYILPFVSIAFLNNFSAGLNYYYFCANIITFGQQALIKSFVNDEEIHKKIQENKKKPVSNKRSKFQQQLEEMAKQKKLEAAKPTGKK